MAKTNQKLHIASTIQIHRLSHRFCSPIEAFKFISSEFRRQNPKVFCPKNKNLKIGFVEEIEKMMDEFRGEKIPLPALKNMFEAIAA